MESHSPLPGERRSQIIHNQALVTPGACAIEKKREINGSDRYDTEQSANGSPGLRSAGHSLETAGIRLHCNQ